MLPAKYEIQVTYIGLNNLFSRVTTLLLKQSPVVKKLILYGDQKFNCHDESKTDRSNCQIISYSGKEDIFEALQGVDIVLIGDELIKPKNEPEHEITALKLYDYAKAIAQVSPEAFLVVAATPINVFMPFIAQLYSDLGCFNAGKLIGASTVDTVRANALLAAQLRMDPTSVVLPVVGGCSPLTRVPLFSHAYPSSCISYISSEKRRNIINKIKNNEKNKQDDAIEKAYATVRLIHSIAAAIKGPTQIPEIALVKNYSSLNVEYFALPLLIGEKGVEKVFTLKNITKSEDRMVKTAIEHMNLDVDKAKYLLSVQNMDNDDEFVDDKLSNEEQDYICLSDVNFNSEKPQKEQKRTSEKDFKSTKLEGMVPLHCPAEPYLETPSASRQKSLEEKKTSVGWRLAPPYGIKKKNIGDFSDDSDFTKLPGINKYLRESTKDDRFDEIGESENHLMAASERSDDDKGNQYKFPDDMQTEYTVANEAGKMKKTGESENHLMAASERSDDDKGNQFKFPDDMQTEFTLDNEADIASIKRNLRKSIEVIKAYNKVQKRNDNNKTNWDENLDDTTNQDVNQERDIPPTNFENKFTNVNEENDYFKESGYQQESEHSPNVLRQKNTEINNMSATTKHAAGTLETPSMDAEYKIVLVQPNTYEAETNEIPENIRNYDIECISEKDQQLPNREHIEEMVKEPSSLMIKINDNNQENTLNQKQPLKSKLESTESYFQNSKTVSNSGIPIKGAGMPKTPSRAKKSENLEISTRNEGSSSLSICDSKVNMPQKFIPKVVKDVVKIGTGLERRNNSESFYIMAVNKNKNVGTQPPSRLYDKQKQNVVSTKESTNRNQDVEMKDNQINDDRNIKVYSYSVFGQANNRISSQPVDYLTERYINKSQTGKHGEGNSSATNTTSSLNKNIQKNYKFHKENTSKLQNLSKENYEMQNKRITDATKVQHNDYQKSRKLSQKSKSLSQSNAQSTGVQKSTPLSSKSVSLSQNNAQSNNFQKSNKPFSLKSKALIRSKAQTTDSQKTTSFSPKSKSHAQSNVQATDSQKSKPFSPKSKSHAQSSAQATDSQNSKPFSPKTESHAQSSAQPTDSQKSKPFSPKSKSHAQSSAQPTDSQKSKPFSPKSKSHAQSSAQATDSQNSKPFSPKTKSDAQSSVQPTDSQKSKPFSPKTKSHAQSSAQLTDSQKSKPFSPKPKSHAQSSAQPTDSQKSKPFSPKSKSHAQSSAQSTDTQKSKQFSPKSKSHAQSSAQPTDSQKSKPFSPKTKSHAQSSAQPTDTQKSKPFSPKSKSLTQSTAQPVDSRKFETLSPKSKSFSESNAQPIDSQKSESISQVSKPISQTEIQCFGTQPSKAFAQSVDCQKTKSPTENNNLRSLDSQKCKYNSNDQQQNSISLKKLSGLKENLKEIEIGSDNAADTAITHPSEKQTCSLTAHKQQGISNLINAKTYRLGSSVDGTVNIEHAAKQKNTSFSKQINGGKKEILKAKNLSQKTENKNSKSINSHIIRYEAANDLTESKLNNEVENRTSSKWTPFTTNSSKPGHLKKTATPSLNTENEKIKEIKQQGLKVERTNKGAYTKGVQSNVTNKKNLKKEPTTNLQLIHQIKLEEKKLMMAQGKVNKGKQQLEKTKTVGSGKKYPPDEKNGNTVQVNTSKLVKKFNKQTNTEQNQKAAKQFSKGLNIEKTKFKDNNFGNKKSEKTQLNQNKDVKRKQNEVKSEAGYNRLENLHMMGKTHSQVHTRENLNKNICEHTVEERWANTEFPQRKLSIKPIVPIKPKLPDKKIKIALNPVKTDSNSNYTSSTIKDYDVKLINKPISHNMNRSKFIYSDSKANLSTLTEYNRILMKNHALTKNAPIHPVKYSIKSIIEEERNNKNIKLGKAVKMNPTFSKNGIAINVGSEDGSERKVDQVNVNNNEEKKYKIWSPSEDDYLNKVEKVEKNKKISGWGGRLFQLFKNVITRDIQDEQTRTQISTNCLKLKEKLPSVNDVRTKVFIANKIPHNLKTNINNEASLHRNYNRVIDNLKINETNRSTSLNDPSRKGLHNMAARKNDKSMKGTVTEDRLNSTIKRQKMSNFSTATDETIRKSKKEVMAYFGKKVTYNHNLDADSMDNLSNRMMDCRPYRKPVRLMSRFKPLYNCDNSNDN